MLLSYVWIIMVILSIFLQYLDRQDSPDRLRRTHRRSERRHAGAVSVRLSLPLERLCEADREKRTCPEVLRAAPSPAFEALSGGLQRPFGPPGSLRKP